MSSNPEQFPEPDEFGMIPPQQNEPQQESKPSDPIQLPPQHLEFYKSILESCIDFSNELNLNYPETPSIFYKNGEPLHKGGEHLRKEKSIHESYVGYVGSFILKQPIEKPKPEPVEKPDPYPSRAGWRANYLPPHDPLAEEPKDKPKGKIGEYEVIESVTTFDDIGGNEHPKDLLTEIATQFEDPEQYIKWAVPIPKGVLLHGGPGTGKTMLAKAFANKANAAFVEVPVATLRDKYYGQTEKNLQNLFNEAAKHKGQVVIFVDEIDSLLPDRKHLPPSSTDAQMVNTFLQCMDGMSSATNIMVLGATNYPHKLDAAATRAGRFDQKVEVELPDRAGCRDIAAKQLLTAERSAKRVLVEDNLDLEEISQYLQGLNGADVTEILNRVRRTMAQTERAMRKQQGLPEGAAFADEERAALKITTDDIIATAINYRLKR